MKKRYSLTFKITILLVSILSGLVLLILFLNKTFSQSYYQGIKVQAMKDAFEKVDGIVYDYEQESGEKSEINSVEIETSSIGMSVIIVDSAWNTIYSSDKYTEELKKCLSLNVLNLNGLSPGAATDTGIDSTPYAPSQPAELPSTADGVPDKRSDIRPKVDGRQENEEFKLQNTIIEQNSTYIIQKVYDSRLNDYYLEIWGPISSGDYMLMRLSMQSIQESVRITNSFIQYVGIGVIILGILIGYFFTTYITKPIKQLSEIAEKMSELDFEVKYKGNDRSELGLLGHSMNQLSEKLEENISQLKAANIELKKDIENKIQIEEMRSDFLSNVSHELKTPIALIQGYAEGLKEGISDDPESKDFYCDVIMDEANKMNNMVKKLLTLNQIEFGQEELIMDRFDLTELVTSIVNANLLRAGQKDIRIFFDEKEPVYVWSDEYKIEEVITNFITNAINHCEFEKKIIIRIIRKEKCVRVSVFNTGRQIPEEDIDNIWIKFYKVDKARTREYGGNGIGLSIVKAIMDSYDKECGVINHADGVEFWFELDSRNE